jgi:metal-responsive CopG/Arc/MetJ family transcriptional regulator
MLTLNMRRINMQTTRRVTSIYLPPGLLDEIDGLAKDLEVTRSHVLSHAIDAWVRFQRQKLVENTNEIAAIFEVEGDQQPEVENDV